MIGAIIGDIVGSVHEGYGTKTMDFELFSPGCSYTDDTVMTVAVADAILHKKDYKSMMVKYGRKYPEAGYGRNFNEWLHVSNPQPYNSWGNGAAMRVSPIGFAFGTNVEVLDQARKSAEISHNHPEGIKGAQATALAVHMALNNASKQDIKREIELLFGYNLSESIDDIRQYYHFDLSCQGTVPQSIRAFLESEDYEHAIRLAISLGGDADTMACIAGGIAQAYYKFVPVELVVEATTYLPNKFLDVIDAFDERYINNC